MRAVASQTLFSTPYCDDNLGPAGSDLDPYDSTRYHHDPRASYGRHRRPSFKRFAPLGMWQHSGTRTYQVPCIASQRLACIAPRAVRPQLSSRNCPARRSIHLCTICLPQPASGGGHSPPPPLLPPWGGGRRPRIAPYDVVPHRCASHRFDGSEGGERGGGDVAARGRGRAGGVAPASRDRVVSAAPSIPAASGDSWSAMPFSSARVAPKLSLSPGADAPGLVRANIWQSSIIERSA